MIKSCWKPTVEGDSGRVDGLLWYKDLGQHVYGEFSMAVIQANSLLEDQSQLESGPLSSSSSGPYGIFIGVYDGHGGPEASRFINDNLFCNLKCTFPLKLFVIPSIWIFTWQLRLFFLLMPLPDLLSNSTLIT